MFVDEAQAPFDEKFDGFVDEELAAFVETLVFVDEARTPLVDNVCSASNASGTTTIVSRATPCRTNAYADQDELTKTRDANSHSPAKRSKYASGMRAWLVSQPGQRSRSARTMSSSTRAGSI